MWRKTSATKAHWQAISRQIIDGLKLDKLRSCFITYCRKRNQIMIESKIDKFDYNLQLKCLNRIVAT